ncbi:MAG: hypothetical protein K2K46_12070 [Lachnospiraceae bacterium]|nr:hypothetical protein [Lachnospiraceae bacterium]
MKSYLNSFYNKVWKTKIPQLLFYIGLTIELGMVIIDKSNYINPIEGYLFRLTFAIFALKLLLTEYSRREWILIAFTELIALISYRITGKNDVIRIVTFVFACKGIPLKQMLRYTFYVTLLGCVAIVFLSVTGIYGDMRLTTDYGRGYDMFVQKGYVETRYTLGMGHPNALAAMFLMLLAMGIYVFSERMKWYVYLFLMLLNVGVYKLTDSKTSMAITTCLLLASFIMSYSKWFRERKIAYICGLLAFVLCVGFSVDAAANAPRVRRAEWRETYLSSYGHGANAHIVALMRIDQKINGRILALTDSDDNNGAIESWKLFSSPNNMEYYFDMGWVKLFYRYGIIPGILYCIASLALLWKFYKEKDAFGLVIFTVMTIYTVVEAHLFSIYIGRNFMLMMMGAYFLQDKTGLDKKAESLA